MKPVQKLALLPVSEVAFGEEAEKLFRSRYVELFGGATGDDPLYEAVSAGQRYPGQEHWLPLFHEHLETLFDYLPGVPVSFDHLAEEAVTGRFEQIAEHYDARLASLEQQSFGAPPYKPVPPERMYLDDKSWSAALKAHDLNKLTPFEEVEGPHVRSWRGRAGRSFAAERQQGDVNVFDAVVHHVKRLHAEHRRVVVAAWTPGARERLSTLLADHGLGELAKVESYAEALALPGLVHRARRARPRAGLRDAGARRYRRAGHPRRPARAPAPQAFRRRRSDRGDEPVCRRSRRPRRPRHRPLCRPQDDHRARCPARLPRDRVRGRRQAVPARREHRAALALRRGRGGRAARPARRRRLAVAQGAAQEAAARDRVRADQDRGAAPVEGGARDCRAGRRLRRVRRALPLRGDRGPGRQHRSGADRSRLRAPDGPPRVRRRRLRQDGGRAARSLHRRHERLPGGGRGADDAARAPTLQDLLGSLQGPAHPRRAGLAPRRRQGAGEREGGPEERRRSTSSSARMRCSASRSHSTASACSSSTRSSTSASPTRSA